ncbi:MAG: porin [Alphaproteobacteria bacterium]|nr:porin [Alphaproteobacteria bacterium]
MTQPIGFVWRRPVGIAASVLAMFAVASPADAAEKLSLGIGGDYSQYLGYADNDTNTGDFSGFDVKTDGTLTFGGMITLDNGLSVGAEVGLKAQSAGNDQIDGSMLYIENAAGRLEIGQTDTVAALMHYSAPDVGYGINDSDISDWVVNLTGGDSDSAFQSTYLYLGEDQATKINIFTPRFAGFQFGVSYLPEFERDSNAQPSGDIYSDGIALGANFVESFGETDVAIAVGYLFADKPDGVGAAGSDAEGYSFGANLTYAGFTVGGSYANTKGNPGGGTDTATSFDGDGFDIGVAYAFGDASVSVSYYQGSVEDSIAIAGDSEHKTVMLSGAYEIGPGITALGSLFHSRFEADSGADNEGWAMVTGVTLEF